MKKLLTFLMIGSALVCSSLHAQSGSMMSEPPQNSNDPASPVEYLESDETENTDFVLIPTIIVSANGSKEVGTEQTGDVTHVGIPTNNNLSFLAYPNPTTSTVTVDFGSYFNTASVILLYNNEGQVVKKVAVNKNIRLVNVALSDLITGTYIIKLEGEEDFMKIIKQ